MLVESMIACVERLPSRDTGRFMVQRKHKGGLK